MRFIAKSQYNKYYEKVGGKVLDISDEVPFDIPVSWEWVRFSSIANLYTGNSIGESEKRAKFAGVDGMEYIGTKDVGFNSKIDYNNGIAIPDKSISDFKIAPSGSVIMCIEGGSAGRKVGIIDRDICFGNKLCCFVPFADIAQYIFFYIQSPTFFKVFQKNKTGIIGGVSVNTLKEMIIALPPQQEQGRMNKQVREIFSKL